MVEQWTTWDPDEKRFTLDENFFINDMFYHLFMMRSRKGEASYLVSLNRMDKECN